MSFFDTIMITKKAIYNIDSFCIQNMLPKTKKGGILLEDLFEDIEMIISERMGQPIKKTRIKRRI